MDCVEPDSASDHMIILHEGIGQIPIDIGMILVPYIEIWIRWGFFCVK